VVKKSTGKDKSVYLGLSSDVHRALRHIAADQDISVSRLLKNLINVFVATSSWSQQSVVRDFSDLVPTSQSNGEDLQPVVGDFSDRVPTQVSNGEELQQSSSTRFEDQLVGVGTKSDV
jgi:hypothetical protein